jgi:hypothetical protein
VLGALTGLQCIVNHTRHSGCTASSVTSTALGCNRLENHSGEVNLVQHLQSPKVKRRRVINISDLIIDFVPVRVRLIDQCDINLI